MAIPALRLLRPINLNWFLVGEAEGQNQRGYKVEGGVSGNTQRSRIGGQDRSWCCETYLRPTFDLFLTHF